MLIKIISISILTILNIDKTVYLIKINHNTKKKAIKLEKYTIWFTRKKCHKQDLGMRFYIFRSKKNLLNTCN